MLLADCGIREFLVYVAIVLIAPLRSPYLTHETDREVRSSLCPPRLWRRQARVQLWFFPYSNCCQMFVANNGEGPLSSE